MKLPLCWLKDYVDFEDTPKGLADKLTFSGVEVEGIEVFGGDFTGVVVGEVRAVNPHPNADRLKLVMVFDGSKEQVVVCGAPVVEVGAKYPFAVTGTTLPNGMTLKKAKIRGVVSEGMLCAEDELGISEDHSGLLRLDDACKAGTPLSEILGPPEVVLDLEITPNRPDCLSVIGLAREVSTLYGKPLKLPAVDFEETAEDVNTLASVEVKEPEKCPRYTARVLQDVKISPSPEWMQKRLKLAGVRPISNIVDITNFVMLEAGQPLHAFDKQKLMDGKIIVRLPSQQDRLSTLDGIERKLESEMLLIADARQPVALAGVMGGAGSEIGDATRCVLLESACFNMAATRSTSRKLGLSTDSSYRFERGVDIGGVDWASRRAAKLMIDLAGAKCAHGVIDIYSRPAQPRSVVCRLEKINSLLGIKVDPARVRQIFEGLGLQVTSASADSCTVNIPTFRGDIEREVDLIEEVARINGLDKIPAPAPQTKVIPGAEDRKTRARFACRNILVGLGLREVMSYSLVSQRLLDLFDTGDAKSRIVLPHPISADQSVLRTSLIPQMVENLGYNRAHQLAEAAFFEIGHAFFRNADGAPSEEDRVALGLMGSVGRASLDKRKPVTEGESFLWMRGMVEALLADLKMTDFSFIRVDRPYFEPGYAAAVVVAGIEIGVLGVVRRAVREEWRISDPAAVAELRTTDILGGVFSLKRIKELAPYPPIQRDIAMLVDEAVTNEAVMDIIRTAAPRDLERIELFDVFTGKNTGPGRKSLAYSLIFRSPDKTLTDEQANGYYDVVKRALEKALPGIEMREA
ncbi:MAG: phenylalanine--tRNA ligase subunit beta [Kiritimatiellia bacterium]